MLQKLDMFFNSDFLRQQDGSMEVWNDWIFFFNYHFSLGIAWANIRQINTDNVHLV